MRISRSAIALAMCVALAGCSSEAPPQTDGGSSQPPTTSLSEVAASSGPATSDALGPVTGTKTITGNATSARNNPVSVRLDFHGLHRDGKLLRLDYSVTNLAPPEERFFIADLINTTSVGEIVLLDTTRLKKYLVVRDSERQFLFNQPSVYLVGGQRFEGAAYFAAPPADVTELELVFTKYGRFTTPVTA